MWRDSHIREWDGESGEVDNKKSKQNRCCRYWYLACFQLKGWQKRAGAYSGWRVWGGGDENDNNKIVDMWTRLGERGGIRFMAEVLIR